jgi:hypothetical protein
MANLQIRQNFFAKRCEVCHQIDRYDPITDVCTRCEQVKRDWLAQSPPLIVEPKSQLLRLQLHPQWYSYLANSYLSLSAVINLAFFSISNHTFVYSFVWMFIGIIVMFLGLSALVHGTTKSNNLWKVIAAIFITSIQMAL